MNEEKMEKLKQRMHELFGDKVPDPEVFPRQFDYYVKLTMYEDFLKGETWMN